ncbi:hypothetical protein [Priestia megaterium]|uniref:hypothetical protein n=1 Tax=Priestia megaterium TaxID=1404 RepID=UPI001FB1DE5C|nr:hypothetical protein [Priestia megaterium]
MNKSVSLSLKSLFFLIVSIVILVVIILQLPTLLSYLKSDNDRINAILGIVGNIIGGIIGGIVAYYVAAYQIKKGNDQNNNTNLKQAHINLRLLLDEIDFNLQVFQIIESNSEDFQLEGKVSYLNKQLVNDQWNKILPSFADYISTEDFKDICELYRKIHFFKINSTTVNAQFITVTTTLIKK